MKSIKIAENSTALSAYLNKKNYKIKQYERAYNKVSEFLTITDDDLFKKDFVNYVFHKHREKINLPYIELDQWIKVSGFDVAGLNAITKAYNAYDINIFSNAVDPDFNIYITTQKQKDIYEQLQAICEILNKHPEHMDLFFNATNQFSKCIERTDGKAEINALWISQIS